MTLRCCRKAFFYAASRRAMWIGAAKYADPGNGQDAGRPRQSARLALAMIAFKHRDYADVAQTDWRFRPRDTFTSLTVPLFDGWAAAAMPAMSAAARLAPMAKALQAQSTGAEGGAFHAALIAGLHRASPTRPTPPTARAALTGSIPSARSSGGSLWQFSRTPGPTPADAKALYDKAATQCRFADSGGESPRRACRRSRPAKSRRSP